MNNHDTTVHYIDAGAITIWLASFANILPPIAAFLSIIWMLLRIAETQTVQQLLGSWSWIKKKETKDDSSD